MNFTDYQNQPSSEKIVLATIDASKRLMGWALHSGSVYKLTGVTFPVIVALEDSGASYTAVASIGTVIASTYFLDADTATLYLRTAGSDHPNSRFLVATYRLFFANAPIALPHDLSVGFEVFWEPQIKGNSAFGVEIDTINQTSEAIEGSGSLTLHNDQDFWPKNFDKLTFENKPCSIYSYNRELDVTEAKLIFRGKVEKRSYTQSTVTFSLKDTLAELKSPVSLNTIGALGARNNPNVNLAYQRMILGRVYGYRPTNIDEVLTGYPLSGTVLVALSNSTLVGTGTNFLTEIAPDDQVTIGGTKYTIASVSSNTAAVLTEQYTGAPGSGVSILLSPNQPKRWQNRLWKLAGHALREPSMTVTRGSTVTDIYVSSTVDIFAGDTVYVGTLGLGELATVGSVINGSLIRLSTSLATAPNEGVTITRPCVQSVRLGSVLLTYYRDYTVNAALGTLTLRATAEGNAGPVRQLSTNLTYNGTRTVTGTGLDAIFKPGYLVGRLGQADYFEVTAVTETTLTISTNATYSGAGIGLYKPFIFDPSKDVVSCDVLGRTVTGLTSGALIRTGPAMVSALLTDMGLGSLIDVGSFSIAESEAGQDLGLVVPDKYNDAKAISYRDVINSINKSINGTLVQTNAFDLSYVTIQPNKSLTCLRLTESDILSFSADGTSENMIKTSIVTYMAKEFDYLTSSESIKTSQKTSDAANYLLDTDRSKTFATKLISDADAAIYANRWALLLERSSGRITLRTKMQAALIEVGDVIDIEHRKLFVRFGGNDNRRIVLVESVKKDGSNVTLECVDLSNAFNSVSIINTSATDHATATDEEKIYNGYITDDFGMIANNADTFGLNIQY